MSKRKQYQTQSVFIPSGTAAGSYEIAPFEINPGYKKISGIRFIEVSNAGALIPRVSLKDTADVFIDDNSILFLKSSSTNMINTDFIPVNIQASGNKIIVIISNTNTSFVSDYKLDIIYELTDENVEDKPRIKYKSETFSAPINTTFLESIFTMDLVYNKVTGIAIVPVAIADDIFRLTFSDLAGEFITYVPYQHLVINYVEGAHNKFNKADLIALGNKVTVKLFPATPPLVVNTSFDIVFRLEM